MSVIELRDFIGREHDFDFLVGRWNVLNTRLRQRHVGSNDWDEFPGVSTSWVLLDGIVSIDEFHFPTQGFSGCAVRTLDRIERRWSIYWINSTNGLLYPPVHGGFHDDRGEFHGEDVDDGRPILVRYIWTGTQTNAPRWEQAFSIDGGRSWETNWIMTFTAARPAPTRP